MAGASLHFGMALGDRADEADADRLAHRHHPVAEDGERGGARADALDQGRHHSPVQEADRLAQLVAHLHPHAGAVGVVVEPLGAEQGVEVRLEPVRVVGHRRADLNRSTAPRRGSSAIGFPSVALTDDQRAMIRLLAQREEGYEDIAALMGLSVEEVRARVKEALEELDESGEDAARRPAAGEGRAAAATRLRPTPPAEPPPPAPRAAGQASASRLLRLSLPSDRGKRARDPGRRGRRRRPGRRCWSTGALGGGRLVQLVHDDRRRGRRHDERDRNDRRRKRQAHPGGPLAGERRRRRRAGAVRPDQEERPCFRSKRRASNRRRRASPTRSGSTGRRSWRCASAPVDVGKSGEIAAQFPIPTELLAYVASGAFDQIDISLTDDAAYKAERGQGEAAKAPPRLHRRRRPARQDHRAGRREAAGSSSQRLAGSACRGS